MKKIIVLLTCLLLISCGSAPIDQASVIPQIASDGLPYGVGRFIDHEAGVVCWLSDVYYGNSISCLPIGETLLTGVK